MELINFIIELKNFVTKIGENMIYGLKTMNNIVLFEMKWIIKSYKR